MLKQSDSSELPRPDDERPIGELVHQLIDDGKAYARAEAEVVKSVAAAKVDAVKTPAILFAIALVLGLAAVNVLAVAVLLALTPLVGSVLAGLVAFLLFAGIAGTLAWVGAKKLRERL